MSATRAAAGRACIMGLAALWGLGVTARATGALLTWMPLAIMGCVTMTPPWPTRLPWRMCGMPVAPSEAGRTVMVCCGAVLWWACRVDCGCCCAW